MKHLVQLTTTSATNKYHLLEQPDVRMASLRFRRKKEIKRNDARSILDSLKEDEETLLGMGELEAPPSRSTKPATRTAPTNTPTIRGTASNNIHLDGLDYKSLANGHHYSIFGGKLEQDCFRQKLQNRVPLMEVDALFDYSCDESTDCETSDFSSTNSRKEAPRVVQFFPLFCRRPEACLMQSTDSSDSDDSLEDSVDDETEKSASMVSAARRLPSDLGWNKLFKNQRTLESLRKIGTLGSGLTSFNDRDDQDSLYAATYIAPPPPPPSPAKRPKVKMEEYKLSTEISKNKLKADGSSTDFEEEVPENDNSTFLGSLYSKSLEGHVQYDSRYKSQDGAVADSLIALKEPPLVDEVWRPVEEELVWEFSAEDNSVGVSVPDHESFASIELKWISSLAIRKSH